MSDRTLPMVIGETENTLRALLRQTLRTTGIGGYQEWVVLNLIDAGTSPEAIATRLRITTHGVAAVAEELIRRGLLLDALTLSERGRTELAAARESVGETTSGLVEGVTPDQAQVSRVVLETIQRRAAAALGASPVA